MFFKFKFFFYIIVLLTTAFTTHSSFLKDLAEEIIEDVISIFTNGTVKTDGVCRPSNDSAPKTEYWLYTRDDTQNPIIIKEPILNITSTRSKVILISHGWIRSARAINVVLLKDAFLKRYDANVILLNWEEYAHQQYFGAFCAVPRIASNVANFLCQLSQNYNIPLSTVHVVGHSLGAQLFGITGKLVFERCGETLGRITGLDPAGPLYQGIDRAKRLDPTDADFVDVIHVNMGLAGYLGTCGHIDSYANCGFYQPGCALLTYRRDVLLNVTKALFEPIDLVTCSHERSCDYFAESISSDKFIARQCRECGTTTCTHKHFSRERIVIGEDCTKPGETNDYVFTTNMFSPFAKGDIP